MSKTTSLFEADATWGRLPYLMKYVHCSQRSLHYERPVRSAHEFKCAPPFIRLENDVIVHQHWNTLHKRGGKQSGDINWLIITKPHLLNTQEARLQLRGICNVVYYFTILVLGVTVICNSVALTSVSDKS